MERYLAVINQCAPVAEGIFEMVLHHPAWLGEAMQPGQFAHLRLPLRRDLLLRRPISIMDFDPETAELKLIIQAVGEGTRDIVSSKPGDEMDVIVPIGRGFSVTGDGRPLVYLCGGGVGVAPLHFAAKTFAGECELEAFAGYRSSSHVYCAGEMEKLCRLEICTDDGSVGYKGYAPELLAARIAERKPDLILACGPVAMLRAVQRIASGIACQLSLEERMGCGVGACVVCNCKVRKPGGDDYEYRRVCVDGPVFPAEEVMFDG